MAHDLECFLLLQWTRVWFLSPTWRVKTTGNSRCKCPLLTPKGSYMHVVHKNLHMLTYIQINT